MTREFLKQLTKGHAADATIVRTCASVRHFARWIHHTVVAFPLGCPTDGIKPPQEPEPQWKGLSRGDELRLLNAAQTLRVRPGRGTNRGLRDHAALAVLLGSGLRASELLNLNREQYTGRGFKRVVVKGGRVRAYRELRGDGRRIAAVMSSLVLAGWVSEDAGKRGPLPTKWKINPQVHALFAKRAAQERERREAERYKIAAAAKVLGLRGEAA